MRDVARAAGGPAYVFYAPIVVPDPATAVALRRQSDIARASEHATRVTKAVVGIGRCSPGESTLYDAADESDHAELSRLGVCAEVSGVFLNEAGEPVETLLAQRVIAVNAQQLAAVPTSSRSPTGRPSSPRPSPCSAAAW